MDNVRKLISNIYEGLQDYFNSTPVMEVEEDIIICVLNLMKEYKAQYINTDSVKVSCMYDADALEDFDIEAIEKTMEQPIDYKTRKPFRPKLMGIYRLAGTDSKYQCIALDDVYYTCTMRNIKSGWTCVVYGLGIYNNYSIDWDYSTGGHFEKE